jgi:hypothetical protein
MPSRPAPNGFGIPRRKRETMPYATNIDVVSILGATLNLLENGQYLEKDSPSIRRAIDVLRYTIADLKFAKLPPAKEEPVDSDPRAASARRGPR